MTRHIECDVAVIVDELPRRGVKLLIEHFSPVNVSRQRGTAQRSAVDGEVDAWVVEARADDVIFKMP